MLRIFIIFLLLLSYSDGKVLAASVDGRIAKLERTISLLQRRIYQSKNIDKLAETPSHITPPNSTGLANIEVKLSYIEERISKLQGMIEITDHNNKVLENKINMLTKDIDFMFSKINPPATAEEKIKANDTTKQKNDFATPEQHYNYGFNLFNQGKYSDAEGIFNDFIEKNPKHKLIAEAYYWLGESYYKLKFYTDAANAFSLSFEASPKGVKSTASLLKLAMSLNKSGRKDEACIIIKQVSGHLGKKSKSIKKQAITEQKNMQCK